MSSIKLSSKLPGGDGNGLAKIAGELVKSPQKLHVLVALVDSSRTVTDHDTGDSVPVVRVRRVEVVLKKDLPQAEQLLRRALEARTGETVLPLELEDEISQAFSQIDLNDPNWGEDGIHIDPNKSWPEADDEHGDE